MFGTFNMFLLFLCLQWRARLNEALKAMNSGGMGEKGIKLDNVSGRMAVSTGEPLSNKAYIIPFNFISKLF